MTPRELWRLFEPVHAVTYFDPRANTVPGLGFWASYVVLRSAPLGAVDPAVVTAAFFGFHPRRAAKALPSEVSPAEALALRSAGAVAALPEIGEEVADLLWAASQQAACAGRVLAAANQALPRPDDPTARAWQACTTLREHRGDGHLAALLAHDLDPLEAMQLKVVLGLSDGESLRLGRGWSVEEWVAAEERVPARGDLAALSASVEDLTDRLATQPWEGVDTDRVAALLAPVAADAAALLPPLNPIGLT